MFAKFLKSTQRARANNSSDKERFLISPPNSLFAVHMLTHHCPQGVRWTAVRSLPFGWGTVSCSPPAPRSRLHTSHTIALALLSKCIALSFASLGCQLITCHISNTFSPDSDYFIVWQIS